MTKTKGTLKPAPGYIFIEPAEEEKKTASGIVLPDSHEEKPQKGKVIAIGATMTTDYGAKVEAPCKKGDVVIYKKWAGNEYKAGEDGKEYLFVKFEDVMAIEK